MARIVVAALVLAFGDASADINDEWPTLDVHLQSASPDCIRDTSDPGDIGPQLTASGQWQGACLRQHRRAILPLPVGVQPDDRSEYHYFSNFHHDGRFWFARMSKGFKVKRFGYIKTWYFLGIAHLQVVIELDEATPLELFEPTWRSIDWVRGEDIVEIVVSFDVLSHTGDPGLSWLTKGAFPLLSSLGYSYVMIPRWTSYAQFDDESIHPVSLLRLDAPPDFLRLLAETMLRTSLRNGYRDNFNFIVNNCAIAQIRVVDDAITRWNARSAHAVTYRTGGAGRNPLFLASHMRSRGIEFWTKGLLESGWTHSERTGHVEPGGVKLASLGGRNR